MNRSAQWASALCLTAMSLTGCESTQAVVTQSVPMFPPETFLLETPVPEPNDVRTCLDLGTYAKQLQLAVLACNTDKALVREWAERMKGAE